MREIAHQKCLLGFFGFFQRPTTEDPNPFSRTVVKRRGSAQGCAFSGSEDKNLTFTPRNSRKTVIFGPDFDGTIFDRKPLYNGGAPMQTPLIVVVAP